MGNDVGKIGELTGAKHIGVARQDLLDQGSARARHAEDEHRHRRGVALAFVDLRQLRRKDGAGALKPAENRPLVIGNLASL